MGEFTDAIKNLSLYAEHTFRKKVEKVYIRIFMQSILQKAKRIVGVFLFTIFLITGMVLIPATQAKANESSGTNTTNCGGIFVSGCGNGDTVKGNKQVGTTEPKNNISGENLSGFNLHNTNLTGADLSNANLTRVELSGANLSEVKLSKANLSGADFSGVDWSKVNLSKPDLLALIQANLTGGGWMFGKSQPKLSKQDLLDLLSIDLSQVNLIEDNLSQVNLTRANLSKANLTGSNLQGANLSGADLRGANFTGAIMPDGKTYRP